MPSNKADRCFQILPPDGVQNSLHYKI